MPTVFNPRSPYGERHAGNGQRPAAANFNPRSPCGATTPPFSHSSYAVFQSTSPCGERLGRRVRREPRANFNPRPPCGERLLNFHIVLLQNLFQSTLPVWGATEVLTQYTGTDVISIHAPRVGSDFCYAKRLNLTRDFNPRSPCGERRRPGDSDRAGKNISIHAPRVGSDQDFVIKAPAPAPFQSTLPVWGATRCPRHPSGKHRAISIHAPRVGSDNGSTGERNTSGRFQSTLPVWGATPSGPSPLRAPAISIHAPRVGSDSCDHTE